MTRHIGQCPDCDSTQHNNEHDDIQAPTITRECMECGGDIVMQKDAPESPPTPPTPPTPRQGSGPVGEEGLLETLHGYAIRPPWGWDDDFKPGPSFAFMPSGAWDRFLRPALNKEAYVTDGFKAVPVTLRIHEFSEQAAVSSNNPQ